VVDCVAHNMCQGVAQQFQHLAIHFCVGPFGLQAHLFAALARQVTHHAWEVVEQGGDGQHAHPADAVMQVIGDELQVIVVAVRVPKQQRQFCIERVQITLMRGQRLGQAGRACHACAIFLQVCVHLALRLAPFLLPARGALLQRMYLLNQLPHAHARHEQFAQVVHQRVQLSHGNTDSFIRRC